MDEANSSLRAEMFLFSLSLHEQLIFRAAVMLAKVARVGDEFFFSELLNEYRYQCFAAKKDPLPETPAFRFAMKLSRYRRGGRASIHGIFSSRLLIVRPGTAELRRKVRLGCSLYEAEFCVRRMDELRDAA